jgi:molybdopterin-guanine dinucleotide biosynthesis protein B
MTPPPRIHIVGRRNCGKTTLVCDLIAEFTERGLRVASIKHTHHQHELDTPGKDSWKHRQAGAALVGILSPGMTALFRPYEQTHRNEDRYLPLITAAADCQLVIVEGDLHTIAPKVEVWRQAAVEPPWATEVSEICAIVSDDLTADAPCPVWPRSNIAAIADGLLRLVDLD